MNISAYIPCFNNESTLGEAIESIRNQTSKVDQLFVIDDGSSDSTVAVAESLGITVIRQARNLGRGATRARAMQEAQHEIVLCCDATNVMPRTFLERALLWLEEENVAAVFGRITQFPGRNAVERWRGRHLFKVDAAPIVNRHAILATGGALVRKSAVMEAGNFNPELRYSEDRDLGTRLLSSGFDVVFDPALAITSLLSNSLIEVLERYWRWYAGSREQVTWHSYIKQIWFSMKVMAWADLRAGDVAAVPISLISPHFQFWRSCWPGFRRARSMSLVKGQHPTCKNAVSEGRH